MDEITDTNKYLRAMKTALIKKTELLLITLKDKGPRDLFIFNRYILQVEKGDENYVPMAPFHKELCNFVIDNKNKKKLLLLPRGHLKTKLITVGYALQQIVANPKIRILIYSATWQMAVDIHSGIQQALQGCEMIHQIWGDLSQGATEWSQDRTRLPQNDTRDPTITSCGIDTNLVGGHYDIIIMDDVVSRDNVSTADQIQKVIQRYKDSLDLLEPKGQLIVIGTRWHDSDLYGWILDPSNDIKSSYEIMIKTAFDGNIISGEGFEALWPQKFTLDELRRRLREEGWAHFCTPYESPVIMGDFSVKSIGEIRAGEKIIGWKDIQPKARLCQAKVKKVYQYEAEVVEMKMQSGRIVRCTPQHKWFTGWGITDKIHKRYAPAKIGSKLFFMFNPEIPKLSSEQQQLAYWLGGMFDGEGSCHGAIMLAQDSLHNPLLWEKLQEVFEKLNFSYNLWEKEYPNKNPRFKHKSMLWLNGGKQTKMDFLNLCQPFKKQQIINSMLGKSDFVQKIDRVVDIKFIGKQSVYALETETGNYIVWGYGSSNSAQYLNDPVPEQDATFKRSWFNYYESSDLTGRLLNKFLLIDPALSLSKEADYTAFVVVAQDQYGYIYVLDIIRARMSPSDIINEVFRLRDRWSLIDIGIEQVAFQKTLAYAMREDERFKKRPFHITELKPQERSKDQRIKGLQPLYENGKILHNKLLANNIYLEDELIRFPRSTHDDICDALSYIVDIIYPAKQKASREGRHKYLY